jgi:hypothetical protein
MATLRLMNPDAGQIEAAIEAAIKAANYRSRTRKVEYDPPSLARRILGLAEGLHQSDGGGGPPVWKFRHYDSSPAETSSLLAAWWTAPGGEKFVLIDGRRVDAIPATPESARGVPEIKAKPEDAIRGWRKPKPRSLRIEPTFGDGFGDLGRLPESDPTREALRLAALYGDTSAEAALHDYDQEREGGTAR